MCNVCEGEYGKTDDNTCGKCASVSYFIWSALKLIFGIAMTVYSQYIGTDFCIQICQPDLGDLKNSVMENYLVKLFTYHLQSLQIVLLYPIEWNLVLNKLQTNFHTYKLNLDRLLQLIVC
eukprot:TRINITY_DN4095_c0_g1_i3.p4 TRINITY_DN4095_c0_g1~~TRINITY_DN4095_c0_g1_i3.p4  ORF type:complete len:120 (+),score=9.35 TRINITY_DN4095_c0_g1_i3:522-881(+)